ncbi:MAG: cysteine-rich KTR domain-containing protein [Lachnospiraceae bacterium]|nr:cysteine-rich KTR domain-containing protein [Lachnospiraceae bacterium]
MNLRLEWVKCPICGNKTRIKIGQDTIMKSFPLFCPKCKQETLIDVERFLIKVVQDTEPDA